MKMHSRSYGSGEPLLILHGLLGSHENWHSAAMELGRYYEVHTLDQRNHGLSPHTPEMDYRAMGADVAEYIQEAQFERVHLLGHSMGGKTAMQCALDHPEKVCSLLVADIAPRAYAGRHEAMLQAMLGLDLRKYKTRKEVDAALEPAVPDLATRRFLLKNLALENGTALFWKIGLREISDAYRRLSEPIATRHPFPGPALFLRGEESDFLTSEDLPSIRSLFPLAELKAIPGAGHLVHVENPQAFLRETLEFFREASKKD